MNPPELEILHETDHYCVLNKPSGYVVHRTAGAESAPVVLQTLRDQLGKKVFPVHRLDRSTSGNLIMAFNSLITAKLQSAISEKSALKKYLLLCRGHLNPTEGQFDRPLSDEKKIKRNALTRYKVLRPFKEVSWVEACIETGRRHQIRRHFEYEMHHLVGDVNYGKGWLNKKFKDNFDLHRIFLHCSALQFVCPVENKMIHVHCELPDELMSVIEQLESTELPTP